VLHSILPFLLAGGELVAVFARGVGRGFVEGDIGAWPFAVGVAIAVTVVGSVGGGAGADDVFGGEEGALVEIPVLSSALLLPYSKMPDSPLKPPPPLQLLK